MIKSVIKVEAINLVSRGESEHIKVTFDANGQLVAISWLYQTSDNGLHTMVKRRGGIWNKAAGGWTFPSDDTAAQSFFDALEKKHPEWPIIGHPNKPLLPLRGIKIARIPVKEGMSGCLLPFPLPQFTDTRFSGIQTVFQLNLGGRNKQQLGLLIGDDTNITDAIALMIRQGAVYNDAFAKKWFRISDTPKKLQVGLSEGPGWALQVTCDLSNPHHYLVAPEQKYCWHGDYPYGIREAIPWTGTIHTTRKQWPNLKIRFQEAGLEWEGDDPEAELSTPTTFDASRVAGWSSPAPNGHLLHSYQKEGALFCASRGMRALIGDEMGVGKTVQAITAAEATDAPRILVICPANARYVWDREIQGWGARGKIQHIDNQLDTLDSAARWHVVTYDLIAARSETWRLKNEQEEQAFVKAFPKLAKAITANKKGSPYPLKITLEQPLNKTPAFAEPKRLVMWEKAMRRLRGEILEQFLAAGTLLVIMDEAHRVKNKSAKRTKAVQRITAVKETQVLMLTGTPLRNNEHEAAVLLSLLDDHAGSALSKDKGYSIQDIKDYLAYFMIRRTKAEVLPELPEKTRQRIDIDRLDPDYMIGYHQALERAHESYAQALEDGKSEAEARQVMQGGIEMARTALGMAKVLGGAVSELVLEVFENKECCVVFCAHHHVSDNLKKQLEKEKLRVAVVDGRTPPKDRAAIVDDFQKGRLDVFIGGINAAGEAITLTRADTVIFVELDWVPAALLQAEDRIHRVGQRSNCQIIQLVAKMAGYENLDEIMVDLIGSKLARIGTVLGEDTTNIISGSIQGQLHERLLSMQQVKLPPVLKDNAEPSVSSFQETVKKAPVTAIKTIGRRRGRGRSKVFTEESLPSATEWLK